MLGGAGGQFPKITIMAEVDDPATFGKTLDNLMVAVNKVMKERMTAAALAAQDAAAKGGGPGGMRGPGMMP